MLDIAKTRYTLLGYTPSGTKLLLSDLAQELSWEEQQDELAVRLEATITNTKYGGKWLHTLLPLGAWVFVYSHQSTGTDEVFRGRILVHETDEDPTRKFVITAYDPLIHLSKSQDDRYYPSGTRGAVILRDIFQAWGIPIGAIDGPNVSVGKQVFRGDAISDMINTVLTQAKNRGDGKWIVRYEKGKVYVIRPGQNSTVWHFNADANVISTQDQQSIEDLVTQVRIMGKEDKKGREPVVATVNGRTEFGVFRQIINRSDYDKPAAAKAAAEQILSEQGQPAKTRQFVAPDVPTLRRGDKVHVVAGTLNGYYLVSWVQHDATSRTMTVGVESA
jgi:hypothetical protein